MRTKLEDRRQVHHQDGGSAQDLNPRASRPIIITPWPAALEGIERRSKTSPGRAQSHVQSIPLGIFLAPWEAKPLSQWDSARQVHARLRSVGAQLKCYIGKRVWVVLCARCNAPEIPPHALTRAWSLEFDLVVSPHGLGQ